MSLTDNGLEHQQSFNTKESKQQVYQSSGLLDHQASSTHGTSTFWCWSWLVSKFIHRIHVCIWQFLNIFCKFKFLQHGSPHVNFLHGILYHPNIVLDRNWAGSWSSIKAWVLKHIWTNLYFLEQHECSEQEGTWVLSNRISST